MVDAAAEGKDVKDAQVHTRTVEARIADLKVRLHALDVAVDEAGNRLAQVIEEHKAEWRVRLAEAEAEATARFNEAIAEAQAAVDELRPARGARQWLNSFDADRARGGQNPPFAGGRLRVKGKSPTLRGEFDPSFLLSVVAGVTEKEQEPVMAHA